MTSELMKQLNRKIQLKWDDDELLITEINAAKDWLVEFLNIDKKLVNKTIKIRPRIVYCKTFKDLVIEVTILLISREPLIGKALSNLYKTMLVNDFILIQNKFNVPVSFNDLKNSESFKDIRDTMISDTISLNRDAILHKIMVILCCDKHLRFREAVRKYYKSHYKISRVIVAYPSRCRIGINVMHIVDNKLVTTCIDENDELSIIKHECILSCLKKESKETVYNIATQFCPQCIPEIINTTRIGKYIKNVKYNLLGQFDILTKSRIIEIENLGKELQRKHELEQKQLEEKLKYEKIDFINKNRNIVYQSLVIYYVDSSVYVVDNKTGQISIKEFEPWIIREIKPTINDRQKYYIDYLIDNQFYGKVSYRTTINLNDSDIKEFINESFKVKKYTNINEIISDILYNSNLIPNIEPSLDDYFDVVYKPGSIDVIPAYDSTTDTFYDKKVFDFITIDVNVNTMNRIQLNKSEAHDILLKYQKDIANYALNILFKYKRITNFNVPRNMFRLDDMVYIRSENYIRLWFGIKGIT